jgi:hypothetical protein
MSLDALVAACKQAPPFELLLAQAKQLELLWYCISHAREEADQRWELWERGVGHGYAAWEQGRRLLSTTWFAHRTALRTWADRHGDGIRLAMAQLEEALWVHADPETGRARVIGAYEQLQRVRAEVFGERGIAL